MAAKTAKASKVSKRQSKKASVAQRIANLEKKHSVAEAQYRKDLARITKDCPHDWLELDRSEWDSRENCYYAIYYKLCAICYKKINTGRSRHRPYGDWDRD